MLVEQIDEVKFLWEVFASAVPKGRLPHGGDPTLNQFFIKHLNHSYFIKDEQWSR